MLARQALEQLPEDALLLRSLATLLHGIARMSPGDEEEGAHFLEELAERSQATGNKLFAAMALCSLGELRQKQADLAQAELLFAAARELATDPHGRPLPAAGMAMIGLADILRERNALEAAHRLATDGIALVEQWSPMGAFDGHMTLLRIAMAWNDRNGVFAALRKLRAIAVAFDISMLDDYVVDLTEAHVRIAAGNLTAVRQWARRRELAGDLETVMAILAADTTLARLRKYEVVVLARLRLAEGRNADALALLEQLQVVTEHVHRRTLWIEATILCAEAHLAAGAVDRARIEIVSALQAAQPAGFQRIFLDEGEAIRPLLEAARAETRSDQPLSDYIKTLLDALPQGPKQILQSADQSEAELIEPLSGPRMRGPATCGRGARQPGDCRPVGGVAAHGQVPHE